MSSRIGSTCIARRVVMPAMLVVRKGRPCSVFQRTWSKLPRSSPMECNDWCRSTATVEKKTAYASTSPTADPTIQGVYGLTSRSGFSITFIRHPGNC